MAPKPNQPRAENKRPYRAPKLAVHGDLKALAKTTTKAGTSADGGKPATRMGGPPA
jgi:hypothetical protein